MTRLARRTDWAPRPGCSAAHKTDQVLADGQAQSGATPAPRLSSHLFERLEQALQLVLAHTVALVFYLEVQMRHRHHWGIDGGPQTIASGAALPNASASRRRVHGQEDPARPRRMLNYEKAKYPLYSVNILYSARGRIDDECRSSRVS
jgi:hypothetical protein